MVQFLSETYQCFDFGLMHELNVLFLLLHMFAPTHHPLHNHIADKISVILTTFCFNKNCFMFCHTIPSFLCCFLFYTENSFDIKINNIPIINAGILVPSSSSILAFFFLLIDTTAVIKRFTTPKIIHIAPIAIPLIDNT